MIINSSPAGSADFRQVAMWMVAVLLFAFGFRYAKDIIVLVLEKLYAFFIQHSML
jgi:hypothetical protein